MQKLIDIENNNISLHNHVAPCILYPEIDQITHEYCVPTILFNFNNTTYVKSTVAPRLLFD